LLSSIQNYGSKYCIDFDNYTIIEFPRLIIRINRFAGLGKLRAIVVYLGFIREPTIWHEFRRHAIHRGYLHEDRRKTLHQWAVR
jgi:hypothetical protein